MRPGFCTWRLPSHRFGVVFPEGTSISFDDIRMKDDLAAEPAAAERAARNGVVDLFVIDAELAGQFGYGQIAPPGTVELSEQIWRFLPQHLDDDFPLPAFVPLQLRDGAAIELDSDLIKVGDDAGANPASNQRDDRPAERPALRGVARLCLSYSSAPVGPGTALGYLVTHCILLRSLFWRFPS